MSTRLKFPYRYKKIDSDQLVDPLVDLLVETSLGWVEMEFLVDSGADATSLPLSLAEELGISFARRKKVTMGGVEGKGVVAYPGEVKIRIAEEEIKVRCFFIESEIMPLLGRMDIFDQFNLIFDNRNQEIVFEKLNKEKNWLVRLGNWLRSLGG